MADFAALEAFATLAAVRVAGGTTFAFGAFDGDVQAQEFGAVEVFDGVTGVPFILELDKGVSYVDVIWRVSDIK